MNRPTFGQWLYSYFWIDDWLGDLARTVFIPGNGSEYLHHDDVVELLSSIGIDMVVREYSIFGEKIEGCIIDVEKAIAEYHRGEGTHSTSRWGNKPIVYFIEAIGLNLVKVGYTESFETRFNALSTSCPVPIKIIYIWDFPNASRLHEQYFHKKFKEQHNHNEWFRKEGLLLDFIHYRRPFDFWDDYGTERIIGEMERTIKIGAKNERF